ncbi:uncharacterized protein CANTADRAFT_5883 [Suhomyces tanzawaensis NRRL Y-17324]|uniref:PH domain-containing protein n=1 Tax=Suhomyces tanzawaensis NRRL Y-17324 TaxID=984487 RepID=A0A1E4SLB7_9ASCO|nr:uncharacterized protein CANTADRAFT_5883 [Suhomyces tanzawaensis NRRL Y-17324]ODV80222.1 hypothetical protein CANTADRAFT_5883 [Suhomyces tanzawaensis NRRL Y-17324]
MFKIHQPTGVIHQAYPAQSYKVSLNSAPSLEMLASPESAAGSTGTPTKQTTSSTSPDSSSSYSSSVRSSNSSPPSSRANSPTAKLTRSATPPTPTSLDDHDASPKHTYSTNTLIQQPTPSSTFNDTSQDDFLQLIEPHPVAPPLYDTLPPGGCPRFPILMNESGPHEAVPSYSPSIYKIGVVARKLEWLTPYEPAPARSWKNVIMELNSTQLNFYYIPSALENHLLLFKPISQSEERTHNEFEERELRHVNSYLTSDTDLQFYKYCSRLNLLSDVSILDEDSDSSSKSRKASFKKLIRSYSLQRSRIGLAIDYKKRPNVLRMRIESEQLLINFQSTKDLIDWNTAIGIGKDVSLDLNDRELPRFRTVPRRRRRRRSTSLNGVSPTLLSRSMKGTVEGNNRLRSNSEPTSRLKGKLSKLKSKLGSSRHGSIDGSSSKQNVKDRSQSFSFSSSMTARFPTSELGRLNLSAHQYNTFDESNRERSYDTLNYDYMDDEDESEYYDDEEAIELVARRSLMDRENVNRSRQTSSRNNSHVGSSSATAGNSTPRNNDYEEDDIENLSDLHHSDDEDEDEVEVVLDENEDMELIDTGKKHVMSLDHKWEPIDHKVQSKRKFYRNCLRCIKPLTMDDNWVNKSLCRPTTLSPLNFAYLRFKYSNSNQPVYTPQSAFSAFFNNSNSSASLVSLNSLAAAPGPNSRGTFRKRNFSVKDVNGLNLPDSALTRVPNHFLKEFIVGSHGLIPKDV